MLRSCGGGFVVEHRARFPERAELGAVVSSCDAAIVSFANLPILATNSPNKLFDALAAGLPAIVN